MTYMTNGGFGGGKGPDDPNDRLPPPKVGGGVPDKPGAHPYVCQHCNYKTHISDDQMQHLCQYLCPCGNWVEIRKSSTSIQVDPYSGLVLARHVVNILNDLYRCDPQAISELFNTKVRCNQTLADHPTCQVGEDENGDYVRMIGIINALVGVDDKGWGFVAEQRETVPGWPSDSWDLKGFQVRGGFAPC